MCPGMWSSVSRQGNGRTKYVTFTGVQMDQIKRLKVMHVVLSCRRAIDFHLAFITYLYMKNSKGAVQPYSATTPKSWFFSGLNHLYTHVTAHMQKSECDVRKQGLALSFFFFFRAASLGIVNHFGKIASQIDG